MKKLLLLSILGSVAYLQGCSTSYAPREAARNPNPPVPVVVKPNPRPPVVRPTVTNRPTPAPTIRPPQVVVPRPADKPELTANPYDKVPSRVNATSSAPASTALSPAAASLYKQAKVNFSTLQYRSAAEKLERALRINPRHPDLWNLLAQVQLQQNDYSNAITMAEKSNLYAASGSAVEKQNWKLIKVASQKTGNIKLLKKAIQYERQNP
ncbi:MAG: Unknown protein [uncultured Thiotrichaceae bacterium]|uniref:Uncharacterized protein n=1 Tax=uncultured Thiotrichaceae bacterium TaxID=298394 RepID=A0A6S6TWT7_9GAMM|nr:MAG: Unknown protein [uncultured Thiotrichaceae bacterium]